MDRRRFRRFDIPLFAIIEYKDGHYHCTEAVSLLNISSGGALIALDSALPGGAPVSIRIIALNGSTQGNIDLNNLLPGMGEEDAVPGLVLEPRDGTQMVLGGKVAIRFTRPLALNTRVIPHALWQPRANA